MKSRDLEGKGRVPYTFEPQYQKILWRYSVDSMHGASTGNHI